MIPHAYQQLAAFDPAYHQPVDVTTQVVRMPGTVNAPCLCGEDECDWPWCTPPEKEDE